MAFLKEWLIEVGVKKLGPSAIGGAIMGVAAWLLTKNGVLAAYGVISDAAAHTTTIHWDQVSASLIAGLPAVLAIILKLAHHTTTTTISNMNQGGTK